MAQIFSGSLEIFRKYSIPNLLNNTVTLTLWFIGSINFVIILSININSEMHFVNRNFLLGLIMNYVVCYVIRKQANNDWGEICI